MRSAAFVLGSILAFSAFAQKPLVESIDVRVVNVDVTVLDRDGKPVTGLTAADFEVLEDGAPQTITNFHAVEAAGVREGEGADDADVPETRLKRRVLVLIDEMTFLAGERNRLLKQLDAFVEKDLDGDFEWSLAAIDKRGLRIILPPTSDRPTIRAAMQNLSEGTIHRFRPSNEFVRPETTSYINSSCSLDTRLSEYRLRDVERQISLTIGAVGEAVRALGGVEGRKSVLLLSGQLSTSNDALCIPARTADYRGMRDKNLMAEQLRDVLVREANAANASIYVIAPGTPALQDNLFSRNRVSSRGAANHSSFGDVSAVHYLAEQTGGKLMRGSVNLAIAQFDAASSHFYSLGYTPKRAADGEYHQIKVRLKNKSAGYKLHHRDGYSSIADATQIERALQSYVGVVMQESTVPVSLETGATTPTKDGGVVPLSLSVQKEDLSFVDGNARVWLYVSVFDAGGRFLTGRKFPQDIAAGNAVAGPLVFHIPGVTLKKGSYRVVVAVRDEIAQQVGLTSADIEL